MSFQISLSENDLRKMDSDLRERLLKWYFDNDKSEINPSTLPVSSQNNSNRGTHPLRVDGNRVSFPEFMRADLIPPGTELFCKTLKRQKRHGLTTFIEAGKMSTDGTVDYLGQHYVVPSKLAVDVINTNGGNTEALNGYDYIYVRISDAMIQLKELRDRFNI